MASLSNINGLFDVHSTGAILFSTSHGTSGQILKSNGNAAPTWVDASTVIGGPYLPLSGGTLTGATATASGISFTVGGVLTGTTATFSGNVGIGGTPSVNFEVNKTGARVKLIDGTNQLNMGLWDGSNYRFEGDANRPMFFTSYQGNINFGISGGTTMTIQNGKVGIGTNGPVRQLDVAGITKTNGLQIKRNYIEQQTDCAFANGVANQNIDIRLGNISFWGYIEVEITGTYSNQNTPGKLTKVYAVGTNPNGSIYANNPRVVDALGPIKNNIALGAFSWDSTNSTYRIRVSHIVSTGNNYTIKLKAFTHGSNGLNGAAGILSNFTLSTVYTATSLSQNYVYYDNAVGIGTASPSRLLSISDGTGSGNPTDSRTKLYIDANTEAYMSFNVPTNSYTGIRYAISGTNKAFIEFEDPNNILKIGTISSDSIVFSTNNTQRMRITSAGGDVLFGTQGTPNGTSVYGSAFTDETSNRMILRMASSTTGAVNLVQFYNGNGLVGKIQTNGFATSYITSSDYRLKENVVEMTGALDRVSQLKPSRFNFIGDTDTKVDGFLAHEVQEIVPEAITGEKDAVDEEGNPDYQGIDQSKLVPLLVGAIKELEARVKELENK